jgi:hypothetical protein
MDETELIRPQDVLDKIIVAQAHLRNFRKTLDKLSGMTEQLKWEMNVPGYDMRLTAVQMYSTHTGGALLNLEAMQRLAEKDINDGVEFYLPHETRELTQEELANMTEEDMPY